MCVRDEVTDERVLASFGSLCLYFNEQQHVKDAREKR
jgi:hypothetical protein